MAKRPAWFLGAPVLIAFCCAAFLPGLRTIPPVDRDEARFAQASRQMAASGTIAGWVVPRIQDQPRINKPPLVYWVQASTALLLTGGRIDHDAIWMYRVPSVLLATVAVLVTWRLGTAMFGAWSGLMGAILLAICPLLVAEAHQARSDHLLLAVTTAAMAALWRIWRRPDPGRAAPFALWLMIGLGILVKGPVTPMIVALTALSLALVGRDARWLKRTRALPGAILVVALVTPWVALAAQQVGLRALVDEVVDEIWVRSARSREGHWGPPGYHLALLVVLFWPGSMLTAAAVVRAVDRGIGRDAPRGGGEPLRQRLARFWRTRRRGRRADLFCACWIVPSWIVFELVSTKLPHYTLPMYPALAMLSARAVMAQLRWVRPSRRLLPRLGIGLWLLAGLFLCGATAVAAVAGWRGGWLQGGPLVLAAAASVAALALTVAAGALALRFAMRRSQALSAAAAVLSFAALFGLILPRARPLWVAARIMEVVEAADPGGERPLAAERYHEDSLIFLSRGRLERLRDKAGAEWLARRSDGILVVPQARLEALGGVVMIGRVEGFNYSSGKAVDLVVVRVR